MVTVARGNVYTILHIFTLTNVSVFLLKMCKICTFFSILKDYTWTDVDALTMYIWTVIVILVYLCTILYSLM